MQAYVSPTDPLVAELAERLDASQREDWEERAGIMQFDGGLTRGHAECLALLDLLCRHPSVLSGVSGPGDRTGWQHRMVADHGPRLCPALRR